MYREKKELRKGQQEEFEVSERSRKKGNLS